MPSVIDQLWHVYKTEEWWQTNHLSYECFCHYTKKLIEQGNIFYVLDGERVVGYTEVWKINFEQFGKLLCMEPIHASENDVQTGSIAYVANVWIDRDYRFGRVVRAMRGQYFSFTKNCLYHVGEAKRKATGLVKVFRADKLKGERYGKLKDSN